MRHGVCRWIASQLTSGGCLTALEAGLEGPCNWRGATLDALAQHVFTYSRLFSQDTSCGRELRSNYPKTRMRGQMHGRGIGKPARKHSRQPAEFGRIRLRRYPSPSAGLMSRHRGGGLLDALGGGSTSLQQRAELAWMLGVDLGLTRGRSGVEKRPMRGPCRAMLGVDSGSRFSGGSGAERC